MKRFPRRDQSVTPYVAFTRKAPVAVEFYLVEPILAVGKVFDGERIHDIERETYMEEYNLSPDELIAKDFRMIQSSRRGYFPGA